MGNSSSDFIATLLEENNNFTLSDLINGPLLGSVVLLETITALVANIFVLIVTLTNSKFRRQPSTVFLNSLLIGDLVMIVTVYPFMTLTDFTGYWIFGSTVIEKHNFCQFVGYMFWYALLVVTSTLAVISCDRWLFIVKPLIYKRFMKLPTALVIVIGLWIVCAALNTTPFYGLGSIRFARGQGSCVPLWENQIGYMIYMLVIFLTMIAIIMITSIWTCCFTRSFLARSEATTQDHQLYVSRNRRVCGIFSALLIVCAICFFPPITTAVIAIFTELPEYIYTANVIIFALLFTANPLVQSYFRPEVKSVLISTWNHLAKKLPCDVMVNISNSGQTMESNLNLTA